MIDSITLKSHYSFAEPIPKMVKVVKIILTSITAVSEPGNTLRNATIHPKFASNIPLSDIFITNFLPPVFAQWHFLRDMTHYELWYWIGQGCHCWGLVTLTESVIFYFYEITALSDMNYCEMYCMLKLFCLGKKYLHRSIVASFVFIIFK